jgi:hypothetical protein
MEHRWGQRVTVDLAVRLACRPYSVRAARLVNLSLSGAYIKVPADLRLSRVQVAIALPHRFAQPVPVVAAYVARKGKDGIAVEWCDHAPKPVLELLRHAALHHREHRGASHRPSSDHRQSVVEA